LRIANMPRNQGLAHVESGIGILRIPRMQGDQLILQPWHDPFGTC
jgi:hypothetical protein